MSAGELEAQLAKLLEQHGTETVLNVLASACSCATTVSTADGWPCAAELLLTARNHVLEAERGGITLSDAASTLSDVCAAEPAYEEHEQWQLDPEARRKRGEPCASCRKPCASEITGRYCEHYTRTP